MCDLLNKNVSKIELYKLFYNIIVEQIVIDNCLVKCIISDNVYYDLEIYCGLNGYEGNSIFNSINYTLTTFGKIHLQYRLYNPIYDNYILNKQKYINKFFIDNEEFSNIIILKLNDINKLENDIAWIWNNNLESEDYKIINNLVYFENKYLQFINNNSFILNIIHFYTIYLSPTIGIISPLISAIMPFIILRLYFKLKVDIIVYIKLLINLLLGVGDGIFALLNTHTFTKYLKYLSAIFTISFYIYSIYNSIKTSLTTNKVIKIFYKRIQSIYIFIKEGLHIYNITKGLFSDSIYDEYTSSIEELIMLKDKISLYNDIINSEDYTIFFKGVILAKVKYIISIKKNIGSLLNYIGLIDYHINNYKLFLKGYSLCDYLDNEPLPKINIKSLWHPSLYDLPIKCVKNTSIIDHNYLITGPNASGKSTYIKSVGISVILSQTIGVCNSEYYSLTPFKLINTYINIPDCKGKESLFQAEMNRCVYYLNNIKSLNISKREFAFNIMDEVFSGTNPYEGISGAYSYLYELSKYDNNINLITTHYEYLSKLELEVDNFKNYHFYISRKDGLIFTYKIKKGQSNVKIALELLNKSCFNKDMLNKSLEVYNEVINLF